MKYLNHKYKRKKLVDKSGIYGFIGNFYLDKEIAKLAKKAELKAEQDKIVKLLVFDSKYFRSKNYFVKIVKTIIELKIISCLSQFLGILKILLMEIIFQRRNLKDCLMKVLTPSCM